MKYGIKIWSTNVELIEKCIQYYNKKKFDYIELSAIRGSFDPKTLQNLKEIPVVIHCDNKNVNFADKQYRNNNIQALQEAKKFADFFNSPCIIIHPGYNGSYKEINRTLKQINDPRFCIENMPGKTQDLKYYCLGRTFEEIKKINITNTCLDIQHAVKASATLGINPYQNIKDLIKLSPSIFHLSDGNTDSEIDEHLNIGEGDIDFNKIFEIFPQKDIMMTLETPKTDLTTLKNDIKNINYIKKLKNKYGER